MVVEGEAAMHKTADELEQVGEYQVPVDPMDNLDCDR